MSIITDDFPDRCYLCGKVGPTQVHHMLHGIYRKNADKYGLTVHLCPQCHMDLHDHGTNDKYLEEIAQRAFERAYSHEEFMKVFGKNWI